MTSGVEPSGALLTPDDVDAALETLPGWSFDEDALRKTFRFDGFPRALAFLVAVGVEAERANHHPEWCNVYATVTVRLTTHDAGGVTQKDVDLARVMEAHVR